jgi:hypothetical protein
MRSLVGSRSVIPTFKNIARVLTVVLGLLTLSASALALTPKLPDDFTLSPPSERCGDWLGAAGKPDDATTQWLLHFWGVQKYGLNSFSPFLRERIARLDGYDQEFIDGVGQLCSKDRELYFVNAVLQVRDQFRADQMRRVLGPIVSVAPLVHPAPKYPQLAKDHEIGGFVVLYFVIQADGSISNPETIDEIPRGYGFAAAALAVFPTWKFPAQKVDGKPVATGAIYKMPFFLP